MTYVFIPCQHPEHPHPGRNTAHGPCMATIDKEGNVCGWEPTDEQRQRVKQSRMKEDLVRVKGEPTKKEPKPPVVEEELLAPPAGEEAIRGVGPPPEVPGVVEEFVEKPAPEYDDDDQGYCAEHSKLVREFGPCLGDPDLPCLRTCDAWQPPRPEPKVVIGYCKQQEVVTTAEGAEPCLCGCSECDPPALCTPGCPDWLDRPEDAPECWGAVEETPEDAKCRLEGEECGHEDSCLEAMLALMAETGPTEGWCVALGSRVELGGPCDDTDPEGTCLNVCENFKPLPEEPEDLLPAQPPREVYGMPRRRRYQVIDADTGEALQLSLLGAQWDEYKVKTERWSLSGGNEDTQAHFEDCIIYNGRELRPGSVVEVVCRGYVKERAPIFKKDTYEGKTVIVVESLTEITLLGYRGGPIEVALNVDGEPKVYDEPKQSKPQLEGSEEAQQTAAIDETLGEVETSEDEPETVEGEFVADDGIDFGGEALDNRGAVDEG